MDAVTNELNLNDNNWHSFKYRKTVSEIISNQLAYLHFSTSRTADQMECELYHKAETREEYQNFVLSLITHFYDMRPNKKDSIVNKFNNYYYKTVNDYKSWGTGSFRQEIVSKIEKEIRSLKLTVSRTSAEFENDLFERAENKEEYLNFIARLIIHFQSLH